MSRLRGTQELTVARKPGIDGVDGNHAMAAVELRADGGRDFERNGVPVMLAEIGGQRVLTSTPTPR
jgi:hypothetical protein